jgi:hypothetical protein
MTESAMLSSRAQSRDRNHQSAILRHAAAVAVYVAFAVYLYYPHFPSHHSWQWIMAVSAVFGALGAYALSRRWVAGFAGSCLAGAVYGFGPYMLGLAGCHVSVGVLAAAVPWLCTPAALMGRNRRSVLRLPLWLLPFAAISLYFGFCTSQRLFPTSTESVPRPGDIVGFIAPLMILNLPDRTCAVLGLYHVAIAPLILGAAVMFTARRYVLFFLLVAGLALAFSPSHLPPAYVGWLGASPVLWLSLPMVALAILAAVGLQGLIGAGSSDKKWLLIAAAVQAILAIIMLLLATKYFQFIFHLADPYARLFVQEAKMYLLGMMAVTMVFLMAYRQLRLQPLRWLILCIALALDIFLCARYTVDKVL